MNVLDLVATNKPSSLLNIHSTTGVNDHNIVLFEITTRIEVNNHQEPFTCMIEQTGMPLEKNYTPFL